MLITPHFQETKDSLDLKTNKVPERAKSTAQNIFPARLVFMFLAKSLINSNLSLQIEDEGSFLNGLLHFMRLIAFIFLSLIVLAASIFAWRYFVFKKQANAYYKTTYEALNPLLEILKSESEPPSEMILSYAEDAATRFPLFDILEQFKRSDLFPQTYLSREKAAESRLVGLLMFPTELGMKPSAVEFVATVKITDEDVMLEYFVFRFKDPSEKDQKWMIGVVGPYLKSSNPYDRVFAVFSRFKNEENTTIEEEVDWTHKNVALRLVRQAMNRER